MSARSTTEHAPNGPVTDITKSRAETVRVQVREYQGKRYVDIRIHFWNEDGPEETLMPTKKGVSLPVEKLPELRAAIEALAEGA